MLESIVLALAVTGPLSRSSNGSGDGLSKETIYPTNGMVPASAAL
jgi:hypothetical protein